MGLARPSISTTLRLLAALLLFGAVGLLVAAAFTERWVFEQNGDERVVMGPRQMRICEAERCRDLRYAARIGRLEARLAAGAGAGAGASAMAAVHETLPAAPGARGVGPGIGKGVGEGEVEREELESALARMRYHRKKGLQIVVPLLVAAGLFGALGLLLLWRLRRGLPGWTRSSVRFVTCGIALGLVPFGLVYVDGLSHLPPEGTRVWWGLAFYQLLIGAGLAFLGGALAGVRPRPGWGRGREALAPEETPDPDLDPEPGPGPRPAT
jgi:hypothetical protein